MWRAWLLLLCLVAGSRQLSITEFSVPSGVEEGKESELKCKYDLLDNESEKALFVKWWWTPMNASIEERSQLYQRIAGYDAEALRDNVVIEDNDSIILLNVTPKDSGIYECEVSNIDEIRQHQKMIVFSKGSGPLLNITLTEDDPRVEATCEAFDVAPYPDIAISLNGHIIKSTGYITNDSDGRYYIYENATVTLEEAEGGDFACEIFFNDKSVTHPQFIASQTFYVPTEPTTEAAEDPATATESSDTSQQSDSRSIQFGASWLLVTVATISTFYTAKHQNIVNI